MIAGIIINLLFSILNLIAGITGEHKVLRIFNFTVSGFCFVVTILLIIKLLK